MEALARPQRPVGNNSRQPISFFMPARTPQAMIQVYQEFVDIADDVSAIPKYVGGQAGGGAGRTASGLAMLMGNASKILQTCQRQHRPRRHRGFDLQLRSAAADRHQRAAHR
jgi:hypothetical protein